MFPARRAETFRIAALQVALHGRASSTPPPPTTWCPATLRWCPAGSTSACCTPRWSGNAQHASYAPRSQAELHAKGYQYWALGHVHAHWWEQGDVTIAYPGNLQGAIRETGAHGALLVTAEGTQITRIDRLEVDVLRWHLLEIDASQADDLPDAPAPGGPGAGSAVAPRTGAHGAGRACALPARLARTRRCCAATSSCATRSSSPSRGAEPRTPVD